jgi:hypothetical protein
LGRTVRLRDRGGLTASADVSTTPSGSTFKTGVLVDFFRSQLKEVVSIHRVMFEKLLFEEDSDVGPELAELFADAGRTYLQISERISDRCQSRQPAQD